MNWPAQTLWAAGESVRPRTLPSRKRRPAAENADRTFLFLQGPPGPLFRQLGAAISERGHSVYRINLSGGDERDWPDATSNFRGRFTEWPVFFDKFLREHRITDLVLF